MSQTWFRHPAWLLVVFGTMVSCTRPTTTASDHPEVAQDDPNLLYVPVARQVPLVAAAATVVQPTLTLPAVVMADVTRTVHVTAQVAGKVERIKAHLGDAVQRGQVLAIVSSPDLAAAYSDWEKAESDQRLTRRSLDRARLLLGHGAIPKRELDQAEDDAAKADAETRRAAARLQIIGGSTQRANPEVAVAAPISGTIIEQNTSYGEGVKTPDNTPSLFTIANLAEVWVVGSVYETNLAAIRVGDAAEVSLAAFPGRIWQGRISNLSSLMDPATRTLQARVVLPNPGGLLRPQMFGEIRVRSQQSRVATVVPTGAVVRLEDKDFVYVPDGPGRFRRVQVTAGPEAAGGRIVEGLAVGQQVVRSALLPATIGAGGSAPLP